MSRAGTLEIVRRAVRSVVERTPELQRDPTLRRRLAESMVKVSLAAADLIEEDGRLTDEIGRRAGSASPVSPAAPAAAPLAVEMAAAAAPRPALARSQAAGDIHRQTAVNAAAGVLRNVRDAIDFPGFVTSLISGVFQAMNTSNIQQLQAYADLLGAVGMSTSQFATGSITAGRAMDWAAQQFPAFRVVTRAGHPPRLVMNESAEMPAEAELKRALGATDEEASSVSGDELEETLLPLVRRKLARERQSMLRTMLLMGMNRIVVDAGHIRASMELQVDARSTAEQTTAERTDTRVTTGGSASFGMGMWGASANLQATVGYVKSDEQYSREDIALRAGLRSSVEVGFHTEPIQLGRMASGAQVQAIRDQAMNPQAEQPAPSLLTTDERHTQHPTFDPVPAAPTTAAPSPDSQEARDLRRQRNYSPGGTDGPAAPNPATDPPADAGTNPETNPATTETQPNPPPATTPATTAPATTATTTPPATGGHRAAPRAHA